ncbi:MAG: proprotein convertase P-domain-containing protein [Saprospiraceae bacterium]|nr:proprotein convertase P-domain-containing protein [Saprospiraceae bacterium]
MTWDVANTNKAPVNCANVNIYGSFSAAIKTGDVNLVPLALGVPNDGSQEVFIPNRVSNLFRIIIKAADNIFLTSSKLPSKIAEPSTPTVYFDAPSFVKACQPNNTEIEFKTFGFGGLTGNIDFSILSGLPVGVVPTFTSSTVMAGQTTTLILDTKNLMGTSSADFVIRAIAPGVDTIDKKITLSIVGGDISNIITLEPADGTSGVAALPKYNWVKKQDATSYDIQVSTSPDFLPANLISDNNVVDSFFTSNSILDKAKVYYWRIRGKNECGDGSWSVVKAFVTEALSCAEYKSGLQSISITGVGTPKVELPLSITNEGTANDINVQLVKADHARPGDLVVFLVAPSGKESLLWSKKCGNTANVNVGLDDQSPSFFQCPINSGKVYRPEALLSTLNGEAIKGIWKLRVEDQVSGTGGKLTEFNLEICSNVVLDQPYIVKNETLKIHPGNKQFITDVLLLVQDNNNTADELRYTLVEAPKEGKLSYNGSDILAGARFTQTELNNSKVRYEAITGSNGTDSFSFVIEDGQGGWVSITKFNIVRDDAFVNASNDLDISSDVFISPNPSSNDINIVLTGQAIGFTNYSFLDVAGKKYFIRKIKFKQILCFFGWFGEWNLFVKADKW